MEQLAPAIRELARNLLALEENEADHATGEAYAVLHALEKLRIYLTKLVGASGYQALLARALALAKSNSAWLQTVRVHSDTTLEGFNEAAQQQSTEIVAEGGAGLLAQLFGLLVVFIGEALTMHMIADVWPEARLDNLYLSTEDTRDE